MQLSGPTERPPRVEILPLIDIVFLLLVFFIYAMLSMTVHRGVDVDLPAAATVEVQRETPLCLTIRSDGTLFIDKTPVGWPQLADALAARRARRGDDALLIGADRNVAYAKVFEALDQARAAGFESISLMADKMP